MAQHLDPPTRTSATKTARKSALVKGIPQAQEGRRGGANQFSAILGLGAGALIVGYALLQGATAQIGAKMVPWAVGRTTGLAVFVTLWALVCCGLLYRSPWIRRGGRVQPSLILRLHTSLLGVTVVLLALHIISLELDPYARVGVLGAFVPGLSGYRPLGVACGTVALYLIILIGGSAALSGLVVGRHWLNLHRLTLALFALTWLHGLLTGTDSPSLRPLYAFLAVTVVGLRSLTWIWRSKLATNG